MTQSILEILLKLTGAEDAKRGLEGLGTSMQSFGKSMQSTGLKMTAGITAPVVAMGTLAVMAASDMEESANKVAVVFGESATSVMEFSETASTSLGMSSEQALAAAGTYGNLFTSMGMAQEEAAGMSTELLQLAADLASFNNMDPTVVLEKLRAGLTGETEPLKALGVNLNQATIEAKALELGLVESTVNMAKLEAAQIKLTKAEMKATEVIEEYGSDSFEAQEALSKVALAEQGLAKIMEGKTGNMTAAAKAQASYALILEQTTNAQGDFANTSDGLANTMRIMKATVSDIAAEFGAILLPIVSQVTQAILPLLERFKSLDPSMKKIIVVVLAIAAAIGPLLLIMGTLITTIGTVIGFLAGPVAAAMLPIILIIGLLVAAIALFALAWKNNWGDIQGKTKAVIDWIKNAVQVFLEAIQAFWDQYGERIIATAKAIWDAIIAVIQWFVKYFSTIFAAFKAAFEGDWETFGEKLREAWDMLWEAIKTIASTAWEFIKTAFAKLIETIINKIKTTDWKQVGIDIVKGIAGGITSAVDWIISAVKGVGAAALAAIRGFLGISSPSLIFAKEVGLPIAQGIGAGISEGLGAISGAFRSGISPSGMRGGLATAGAGGGGVTVNFNYAPFISTADSIEAENKISPIIRGIIRTELSNRRIG